jgi:cobalt-zinc-cadmium efflux system protein
MAHHAASTERRLLLSLALALALFATEVGGALIGGSLALAADAGHLFVDVLGLAGTLVVLRLGSRPPSGPHTYGMRRLEVLAAFLNALLLLGICLVILVEAWGRLAHPAPVEPGVIGVVAVAGLVANGTSVLLLRRDAAHSLSLRGAYLDVLADTFGSAAALVGAVVVALTGFPSADAIAAAVIALLIVPRAWGLLRDAARVLLEVAPRDLDLDDLRRHLLGLRQVTGLHDLHAWSLDTHRRVVSVHLVVEEGAGTELLDDVSGCLDVHFGIRHATVQVERGDARPCLDAHW